MEPRQHEGPVGIEQAPLRAGGGESLSSIAAEVSPERTQETRPELGQVQAEISQIAMPALPVPVPSADDSTALQLPGATTPLVASDDDLIEKEWVDKAKSILAATKDDPYRREQEISRLQIEYIRKRYGRVVGDSGD